MKKIFGLLFSCLSILAFGQNINFIKSYGNSGYDYGRDIKQTLDTGYIATGSSSSFGADNAEAFLLKVDSLGNFKWSYNYGGSGADWGQKVVLTNDSSFALAGFTNSFGAGGFDFYLVRAEIEGAPRWEKTYGGSDWDKAYSLVEMPDSGFVLVGETYSFGAGNADMYIVRTDKNGDTLWTRTYGGTERDVANDVILDGDSLVIVGATESFGAGMEDGIFIKMHLNGDIGSIRIMGQDKTDYFTSIVQGPTYYLMGGTRSYHQYLGCDCGQDFWAYKLDRTDLSIIVDTTWLGEQIGTDIAYDVCINPNNDIFYSGSTTSWGSVDIAEGFTDAFMGKLLNNYYTAADYVNNFGEQKSEAIYGTDFCFDNGIVAIGDLPFLSTGGHNIMIVRIDRPNSEGAVSVIDVPLDDITLSITSDLKEMDEFSVYPTPFSNSITINTGSNNLEETNVLIYNLSGKLCYEGKLDNNLLNLEFLEAGSYILKVTSDKGTATKQIIKY